MPQTITYHDNISESFVYSVRGDLESATDRRGNTTSFLYNKRRQPTFTTQPGNRVTERTYDDSANLEKLIDAENHVTRYTYSATGKLLTETRAFDTSNAETTTHFYDERDWLDYTLDPRNQKTDFGYDDAGRLLTIKDPLLHETTFEYEEVAARAIQGCLPHGAERLGAVVQTGSRLQWDVIHRRIPCRRTFSRGHLLFLQGELVISGWVEIGKLINAVQHLSD